MEPTIDTGYRRKLTIWTDGKAAVGRVREEKTRSEKIRERESRKKRQVREKVGKSRFIMFFQ